MTPQQIEALNIAGQCRATASSPLAKNILVDEGNGLLTELLLDAARIIEALAQTEQKPVANYCKECLTYNGHHEGCSHYTHPPQRKPLTDEVISALWSWSQSSQAEATANTQQHAFARSIEAAHGIKE